MPQVFTIFNHGTGSHRAKGKNEIVTVLGKACAGLELFNYMITDGPGSAHKGKNKDAKTKYDDPDNLMPSNFDPNDLFKGKKKNSKYQGYDRVSSPGYISGSASIKMAGTTAFKDVKEEKRERAVDRGTRTEMISGAYGHGWDDNVTYAITVLKNLKAHNQLPTVINMVGWSRGAITCHMMAHGIEAYYRGLNQAADAEDKKSPVTRRVNAHELQINIFAVDPVMGGDELRWDGRNLPGCVVDYVSVLMIHEHRAEFMPVDGFSATRHLTAFNGTNVSMLPFPGAHGACAINRTGDVSAASEVCWNLALRFLMLRGTEFDFTREHNGVRISEAFPFLNEIFRPDVYLEKYSRMAFHWTRYMNEDLKTATVLRDGYAGRQGGYNPHYHALNEVQTAGKLDLDWKKAAVLSFAERALVTPTEHLKYVSNEGGGYFINEHHRWCFQNVLPNLYRHLFVSSAVVPAETWTAEISWAISHHLRWTLQWLKSFMNLRLVVSPLSATLPKFYTANRPADQSHVRFRRGLDAMGFISSETFNRSVPLGADEKRAGRFGDAKTALEAFFTENLARLREAADKRFADAKLDDEIEGMELPPAPPPPSPVAVTPSAPSGPPDVKS